MIHAIVVWALQNRLIVLLAVLALMGVGFHATLNLNVEAYPDPTPPLIDVISQNPGASPEEIERLVTIPIETALSGIPGLEYVRSTSIAGLSDIKCQFSYGTNYVVSRQEVLNRLAFVDLPEGVRPELSPWSPTGEIVRYVLEGPGYTTNQLKGVQDWVLNRVFKQVSGVIDVVGFGGTIKQYQVLVDTRLLHKYEITMAQVESAISKSNANVGGNVMMLGSQAHNVRVIGLLGSGKDPLATENIGNAFEIEKQKIEDIRNVVLTTSDDGTPVKVGQVAQVLLGHQPRLGVVGRGDENDVVEGIVMMRKGEKSLATAKAVAAKIRQIEEEGLLPNGMKIQYFNQRTDLVNVTTHNVLHNLLVGVGLVMLVLLVFLGDIRSALIVASVIPLALLFAISLLYYFGMSANLLSLGAVDFGIIVDSSVIIVETVFRELSTNPAGNPHDLRRRIADATRSVERPMLYSTVIIVSAFVPLFTLTGPAGALFGPMAMTYAFSILGALLISVTFAPVLCSFFFRGPLREHDTILDRMLKAVYGRALSLAIRLRSFTIVVSAIMVLVTLLFMSRLGAEFMPQLEEGNLWIRAFLPRTACLEESLRLAPRLRQVISRIPEVRGVMSHVGRPDDGTDVTSFFNLEFNVPLKPMEMWRPGVTRQSIERELTEEFKNFPGIEFSFSQLIRDNIDEALSGIKGSNSVKLFGSDLATLEATGARIEEKLRSVRGVEDVGAFNIIGQPNLEIAIDRAACARHGINVQDVEDVVGVAIGGKSFSQMVEGEKLYDIALRLTTDLRNDPENMARIPIDIPERPGIPSYQIPLALLAKIDPHKPGAQYIYRENNRRYLPIKFSVRGRDLASAIAEAKQSVDDPTNGAKLPVGYRMEWSGEFAQMQSANAVLRVTVPISITLIIVVLYLMFGSFKDALLVMAGVIIAMIGGIWSLIVVGIPFSISAAVGFISIFGVVVQNGVLLINYFKQHQRDDVTLIDLVSKGSVVLLRPVVMISLTAILGLFPAAIATSVGSQAQKPLAIVVVGGMTAAMVFPQFLLPVLYLFFPKNNLPTEQRNPSIHGH